MSSAAMRKVERIRRIVQLIQGWRAAALRRSGGRESGSGRGSVRSGFLAVYVGPERRRFVIPTRFLNLPVFASLLERAEEEYGFRTAGGLELPCDPAFFRWVLDSLGRDEERFKPLGLDVLLALYADSGAGACKEPGGISFSPLLPNTRA